MVGFDGTWNPLKFSELLEILDRAKELAQESVDEEGLDGFPLNLEGEDVLVFPVGGKAGGGESKGGLTYSYRFVCRGVEFLVHRSPSKHVQPIRVRYLAESVQGHRDRFFEVHFGFVIPYLKRLGLVIHSDKLSRVDLQCLIDVPVKEFVELLDKGHVVTKLRKKAVYGTMTRVETIELGSVSNAQLCIYDKGRELRAKKSSVVKEAQFVANCVGDEWYNSDRPITRVEIRLGRDALKCLGVDSVSDLQQSERGILELLTSEWFRILAEPKVRGHENTAALHPIWERVRELFFLYFTGSELLDIHWNREESLSCDPESLERQALGCLSKALACRYGEQEESYQSAELANGWVDRVQDEMHEKVNLHALNVRLKTGIELGVSSYDVAGYDVELDCVQVLGVKNVRAYFDSLEGVRCQE